MCPWSLPLLSRHVLHFFNFNECPIDTYKIFYTQGVLFYPLQRVINDTNSHCVIDMTFWYVLTERTYFFSNFFTLFFTWD